MMDKPAIIAAIDARIEAGGAFAAVAEGTPLTEARDYIQETSGDWMADQRPPYAYRGVRIYRSMSMLMAPGYVLMDLPA